MGSQEITLRLQEFWEAEGCPTISPYGAIPVGGLAPDVFFGALAHKPRRTYQTLTVIDPSRAPYGDDPLYPIVDQRLQVTLQAASSKLREDFIGSLQMLGMDLRARDVRFVACSWNLSYLAGRAVGWRVLIDHIEVGSLSYLERLGEIELDPAPALVEYSLGRLAISVGVVDEAAPTERGRQIGEYVLEHTNREAIDSLLSLHADECEQALIAGLYYPAYDHVLASIYLLSVLTARDGLGAKGHAGCSRVAGLARGCAKAYAEVSDA